MDVIDQSLWLVWQKTHLKEVADLRKPTDRDISREPLSLFSEYDTDDDWFGRTKAEPKCYCDIKALVSTGHEKGCPHKKD